MPADTAAVGQKLRPETNLYRVIGDHLADLLDDAPFADLYAPAGRPKRACENLLKGVACNLKRLAGAVAERLASVAAPDAVIVPRTQPTRLALVA